MARNRRIRGIMDHVGFGCRNAFIGERLSEWTADDIPISLEYRARIPDRCVVDRVDSWNSVWPLVVAVNCYPVT